MSKFKFPPAMSITTGSDHPSFNLLRVLSESKRIIHAHSRHFLALSVLFLFPLSFSAIFYPWQQQFYSPSSDLAPSQYPTKTELLLHLLYSLFGLVLSLSATCTITYSTFHGFYGKPVKLISSIKSVLYSFLPLLSTYILYQLIAFLIVMSFTLLAILVVSLLVFGSGRVDFLSNKNYVTGFVFLIGIVVLLIIIWLQVNWSLWGVIVVVESKWGYEPLRRSRYLMNGMRGVAFSLWLLYGPAVLFLVWISYTCLQQAKNASGWLILAYVLQIVLSSAFITLLNLYYLAANAVLYMYCKDLHGELALEISDKFASEHVSLTFDYEKVQV